MTIPWITADKVDRIVLAVYAEANYDDAASSVGIHRATFYRALARGRDLAARRRAVEDDPTAGAPLDALEDLYADLADRIEEARAGALVENLALIKQAARGYEVRTTTTTTVTKPDGTVEVRVQEVVRPERDWRAAAFLVEQRLGRAPSRLEISAAGIGTPDAPAGESIGELRARGLHLVDQIGARRRQREEVAEKRALTRGAEEAR